MIKGWNCRKRCHNILQNGYSCKGGERERVISPILCNITLDGVENIIRPNNPIINTKEYVALKGC